MTTLANVAAGLAGITMLGVAVGGYSVASNKLASLEAAHEAATTNLVATQASELAELRAAQSAELAAQAKKLASTKKALDKATAPRFFATYKPTGSTEFDAALETGLAYWEGRDGKTAKVVIVRTKVNECGVVATGCATPGSVCRIWISDEHEGNRWAMIGVAIHEVGHCLGHGHDDADIVMHS